MKFASRVPGQKGAALPLAEYLSKRFTYHDHDAWVRLITERRLTINGKTASVNDTVKGGETIVYDAGEFDEPPADMRYSIIYEDKWLLAVNKPANLLVHRAGRSFRHNLVYHLRFIHTPPHPAASSINRLDRYTSGVVLIAKNPQFKAETSALFRTRQVEKTYIAYVHGIPEIPCPIMINKPIAKDPSATICPKFRIDESGKEAITSIESCKPIGESFARLEISPLTGRTHQIRLHCASMGHPVIGDSLYGSDMKFNEDGVFFTSESTGDTLTASRHALHCHRIVFFHPRLMRLCRIEAPMPLDMIKLENFLLEKKKGL